MDRLKDILAATHDLKNPLLAIQRLSESLMENRESLSEDMRRKLEVIHESALEASGSLEALEDSVEQESESSFSREPVDLAKLARKVVRGEKVHAEHKSQTLSFSVPHPREGKFTVRGDRSQIRRAMENLVNNAVKYSPRGEAIQVLVARVGDTASFSVSDNGPGLAPKEQDRLFEPFHTVGPDPTADEDSTGIGLYLVDQILRRHDGKVEVESEKGEGSTFTLLLPVAADGASSSPQSSCDPQVQESESTRTSPVS